MHVAWNKWVDEVSVYNVRREEEGDGQMRLAERWVTPPQSLLAAAAGGRFFYFQPCLCLPALFFSLGFPISISLSHLFCLCSVVPFFFCLFNFHLSLLLLPPLFFSLSSCINYEFPYLPYIAPVDLLSLIPSLARIGSYGSNRVPLSPAAVKIKFYLPSFF